MNKQESQRTPNRPGQKKFPRHIIIKRQNTHNKERILMAAKENGQVIYKGRPVRITPKFSMETIKEGTS